MRHERFEVETRYARHPEGDVAYQVFGQSQPDLLFIPNWLTNADVMWDEPSLAAYLQRLATFSRVICFDRRGTGVSDPVMLSSLPTLDSWMDDARVVMDTVGSTRAALLGDTEGGPLAMLFAATYPERTAALVLVNSFARWARADDYPIGMPSAVVEKLVERYAQNWGVTAEILDLTAPSVASNTAFRRWFQRYQRLAMPRGAAAAMYRWVTQLDVRSVLPAIRVPTLVLHRRGNRHHRVAFGRYLAEHIAGARYVELDGADSFPFHAGDPTLVLDQVEQFLTGMRASPALDRTLATVLMTDIVDSTGCAARLGDHRWLELRAAHDRLAREQIARYRGREVDATGDGFLALFDGPTRAVTCAAETTQRVRALGLEIRAGLHTGEVEFVDGKPGGIALHIASRVMVAAANGGVYASSTVHDLVVGSGIEFAERGRHKLKGVPGEWALFELVHLP